MVTKKWFIQSRLFRVCANKLRDWINANLGPFYQSYSLEGEDMILRSYFGEKTDGFYVDIGANDAFRQSNTAYFYQRGWKGINIDASKEVVVNLKKNRVDDINIKALVSNDKKRITLYKFNDSALNTVVKELADDYSKIPGYKIVKKEVMNSVPLKLILSKNIKVGQKIDFMSIDVEGFEMKVLESNDWKKYRPEVIVCESLNISSINQVEKSKVYKYLTKLGYVCFAKTSTNLFFC